MSKASETAYFYIRSHILSGQFAPGKQLREEELAAGCGVSRTPVRDALRRMEAELYVRRGDNQRTYVAEWTVQDIQDIFTLRDMLEGYAAARTAERATPEVIAQLAEYQQAIDVALNRKEGADVEGFLHYNRAFHRLLIETAGSERLTALLARLLQQPIIVRTALSYDVADLLQSNAEHKMLVAAITAKDPEWARAILSGHIRRAFHVYEAAHTRLNARRPNEPPEDN
ncbi:MAG: GntR family transcriptional regulator [Rhodospirillaceae bacterium]|nr:GntR family transcriptional regulator [Rhodospirillaceae bacterium]